MRIFAFIYVLFMILGIVTFIWKVRKDKRYWRELWRFTNVVAIGFILFSDDWFPQANDFVQGLFVGIGAGIMAIGYLFTRKFRKVYDSPLKENQKK